MHQEIGPIITALLQRCSIVPCVAAADGEFLQQCLDDVVEQGCSLSESTPDAPSLRPFAIAGASLTFFGYGHLKCLETKRYIALYSALVISIDDLYQDAPSLVNGFTTNYHIHQAQKTPVLQAFDDCLRELPKYFDDAQANLIITSSLNAVTAMALEHTLDTVAASPKAQEFPKFLRELSGTALAYSLFIFSRTVPLELYMQALPYMMGDVLSFYKEELAGEDSNYVSTVASRQGCPKIKVLGELADSVASDYQTAVDILASCTPALEAWKSFANGYTTFHVSSKRYRLGEILQIAPLGVA
ncbi:hypothetical protein ONZ45_g8773 [Pleurotus djamor]|nr:hypothetical protein ONZ45_g8773 [Pleurotus djamor]